MADEKDASCHTCVSDPNFAIICSFLDKFAQKCGIVHPTFAELQEMLEDTTEVAQQLVDLHIKLMRKARKTITAEKWERALIKFCHGYSSQDGWELERFGYKKSNVSVKLRLLKTLLEAQFDSNTKFKMEVNKLASAELRIEPLGRDLSGQTYWCQFDPAAHVRIYREDPDEETWEMVAKDRNNLVDLIDSLSSGEGQLELKQILNEDTNSQEIDKPITDTGQVKEELSGEEQESKEPVEEAMSNGHKEEDTSEVGTEPKVESTRNFNDVESIKDGGVDKSGEEECLKKDVEDNRVTSSTYLDEGEEDSTVSELQEESSNTPPEVQESCDSISEPNTVSNDGSVSLRKENTSQAFEEEEEMALADGPLDKSRMHTTSVIMSANGNKGVPVEHAVGDYGMDLSRKSSEDRGVPLRPSVGAFKKSRPPPGSKLDEIFKLKRGYSLNALPPQSQPLQPYVVGMNHKDILSQMSERFNEPINFHQEQRLEANVGNKRGPEDLSFNSSKKMHLDGNSDDPIVGEAIEEPVMLIKGAGSGHDCDTGNPGQEADNPPSSATDVCNKVPDNLCQSSSSNNNNNNNNDSNSNNNSSNKIEETLDISTAEKKQPKLWSIDAICSPEKSSSGENLAIHPPKGDPSTTFFFGPGSLKKTLDVGFSGEPSVNTIISTAMSDKQSARVSESLSSNGSVGAEIVSKNEISVSSKIDSDPEGKAFNAVNNKEESCLSVSSHQEFINRKKCDESLNTTDTTDSNPKLSLDIIRVPAIEGTPKASETYLYNGSISSDSECKNEDCTLDGKNKDRNQDSKNGNIKSVKVLNTADNNTEKPPPEPCDKSDEHSEIGGLDTAKDNGDTGCAEGKENDSKSSNIDGEISLKRSEPVKDIPFKPGEPTDKICPQSSEVTKDPLKIEKTDEESLDDKSKLSTKCSEEEFGKNQSLPKKDSSVSSIIEDEIETKAIKVEPATDDGSENESVKKVSSSLKVKKEDQVSSDDGTTETRTGRKSRTNSTCGKLDADTEEIPSKIRKTKESSFASDNAGEEDEAKPKSPPARRANRRGGRSVGLAKTQEKEPAIGKGKSKVPDTPDNKMNECPKKAQPFTLATFSLEEPEEISVKKPAGTRRKAPDPGKEASQKRSSTGEGTKECIGRKKRGRKSSRSEDGSPLEEESEKTETAEAGGKRPRLRGKSVKGNLATRQKAEEKRAEKIRSSSEGEEDGDDDDEEEEREDKDVKGQNKKRGSGTGVRGGRGGARRGWGRRGRGRGGGSTTRNKPEESSSPRTSSPPPQPVKTEVSRKKRAKKAQTLMGLLESDLRHVEMNADSEGSRVRASRRIAQIKLKEQAERRDLEEATKLSLKELEKEERRKIKEDKDKKKQKKNIKAKTPKVSDCDYSEQDVSEGKRKTKKKRKRKSFLNYDINNPWRSSSSSSDEEDEEEEDHYEEEDDEDDFVKPPHVSDHEFSPESDLEKDESESQPMRRARTAQKGVEENDEDVGEEYACQKCDQQDHPEWILLCDKCDKGWHASCLRPPLMLIPEGDWFCPPCQHAQLVVRLKETLRIFQRDSKRRENEELRRKRLAYVGISLANVLPESGKKKLKEDGPKRGKADMDSSSSSDEGSSSEDSESSEEESSEEEPVYQLRQRKAATNLTYRFNEFDDLINSAIQDEMEAVKGAGNQGRGKDISTIVNAEKEEKLSAANGDNQEAEKEDREEEPEGAVGWKPPVVPRRNVVTVGRKKSRKLNSLDISSGDDDAYSDEDFKGTSEEEEDEESVDEDSDASGIGGRWKRSRNQPVRRSTRARVSRIDAEFINDDSEESDEPRRKKKRHIWHESESEDSDTTWGKRKKKPRAYLKPKNRNKKNIKKFFDESDSDVPKKAKIKKPKIKYGLSEDDEDLGRRTRGRKINYQETAGSDTEEEVLNKSRVFESEEEFVLENDMKESEDSAEDKEDAGEGDGDDDIDEDEDDDDDGKESGQEDKKKAKNKVKKPENDESIKKPEIIASSKPDNSVSVVKKPENIHSVEKSEVIAATKTPEISGVVQKHENRVTTKNLESSASHNKLDSGISAQVSESSLNTKKLDNVSIKKPDKAPEQVKRNKEELDEGLEEEEEEDNEEDEDEDDEDEEEDEEKPVIVQPPPPPPPPMLADAKLKVRKMEELGAEPKPQQCRLRIKSQADLQAEVLPEAQRLPHKVMSPFVPEPKVEEKAPTSGIRVVPPQKLMAAPIMEEQERMQQESVIRGMMVPQPQAGGYYNRVDYNRPPPRMYQPPSQQVMGRPPQFSGGGGPGQRPVRNMYQGEPPMGGAGKVGPQDQRYLYPAPQQQAYHQPPPPPHGYYQQQQQHYQPPAEDAYADYGPDVAPVAPPPPQNYDDEGEFGGLVSYFSSQREDNLDT